MVVLVVAGTAQEGGGVGVILSLYQTHILFAFNLGPPRRLGLPPREGN